MKGSLKLEIEKLHSTEVDSAKSLETQSINSDSMARPNVLAESNFSGSPSYRSNGLHNADPESRFSDKIELDRNGSVRHGFTDDTTNDVCMQDLMFSNSGIVSKSTFKHGTLGTFSCPKLLLILVHILSNVMLQHLQFHAFDFRITSRNEPFLQLFHCLYVYPLSVSMSRKRNLFIRVELRKDDADIRKPPLEVKSMLL